MKLLEKIAEDWFIKNQELNACGKGSFSTTDAFKAGFLSAREMAAKILDKYTYLPMPNGTTLTEGLDILKEVKEIGEK